MAANLFSFNPFTGIDVGIALIKGEIDRRTGTVRTPFLQVGGAFISLDRQWEKPEWWGTSLMAGDLRQIETGGKLPFSIWTKRSSDDVSPTYLSVDLNTVPAHIKRRVTGEMVKAWSEVYLAEQVEAVLVDPVTGRYLLKFSAENATADIWTRDGAIYRLQLQRGTIVQLALNQTEVAYKRIHQFKEQMSTLNLAAERDIKRYHGVIGGVVRLLRYVRDSPSRDMLVDFLVDQIGPNLAAGLRNEIRSILEDVRHPLSSMFGSGMTAPNVVQIKTANPDAAAKRAATEKRRTELRELRNAACQAAKGTSSGGGKQRGGKK